MRFTYSVHDDSDGAERYGPLEQCLRKDNLADLADAAEAAAQDWHIQHGGWEAHWPVTFHLYDETDQLLGTVPVDREMEPMFLAMS